MREQRILILSHAHPDFSLGGGEIAAHAHWKELRRRGITAMFTARVHGSSLHIGTPFTAHSVDGLQVLFDPPGVDHFRHSQQCREVVYNHFRALLEAFQPTVVHFHHYAHLGLELIREVRKFNPEALIVVTLHEYLAICHADGQMLKTNGVLCRRASPLECHRCFPGTSPQDFFLRELFIKSFFDLVDRFVCPSRFLRDRYIVWGLPAEKMSVIENGQPAQMFEEAPQRDLSHHFVVMGQLSRLKGTLLVPDAVRKLSPQLRRKIRIEIHGSIQHTDETFKSELAKSMQGLEGTVALCGPYLPADAPSIIHGAGWLIVPSIWWENSQLVIQEAFSAKRPVICSNIGGMAEKVRNRETGLHFRVGSASDLAARLEECATTPDLWQRLSGGIPAPPKIEDTVDELLHLYSSAASERHVVTDRSPAIA